MAARVDPNLEDILSRYRLNEEDLDRECPRNVMLEVAVKLDDWQMFGYFLYYSKETLRKIEIENRTEDQRKVALLDDWRRREGKDATYLKLARVLYRRDRRDLVEFLCQHTSSFPCPTSDGTRAQPLCLPGMNTDVFKAQVLFLIDR